jgi:hypothetical protein
MGLYDQRGEVTMRRNMKCSLCNGKGKREISSSTHLKNEEAIEEEPIVVVCECKKKKEMNKK